MRFQSVRRFAPLRRDKGAQYKELVEMVIEEVNCYMESVIS